MIYETDIVSAISKQIKTKFKKPVITSKGSTLVRSILTETPNITSRLKTLRGMPI